MSAFVRLDAVAGVRVTPSCHVVVLIAISIRTVSITIFSSTCTLLGNFWGQTVLLASYAHVLTGATGSYGI